MPPSKRETDPDPAVVKQRRRNKASRIRHKDPDKQTPAELAFLAEYDAEVRGEVAAPPPEPARADPDASHLIAPPGAAPPKVAPVIDAPPSPPPVVKLPPVARLPFLPPPMPPPPRVGGDAAQLVAPGRKRWQDKYGEQMAGREMACYMLGNAVHEFCVAMQGMIELSGGKPVTSVTDMLPVFVLAADELLPPHVEATPALVAAGSAAALSLQALVRRKLIKEAVAKQPKGKATGKLVAMDGGRPRDLEPARADDTAERAAPIAEQPAPPPAEPAAPEQPADGRPILIEPDYPPPPPVAFRSSVPPGYNGIA